MSEDMINWLDSVENKQALLGMFGDDVPKLEEMDLAQMVLDQTGDMKLSLNLKGIPSGSPIRWREKGKDRIQLRFSFYDVFHLEISGVIGGAVNDVGAEFFAGEKFQMVGENIKVKFSYSYVRVDVYPYCFTSFEEPKKWFHQ